MRRGQRAEEEKELPVRGGESAGKRAERDEEGTALRGGESAGTRGECKRWGESAKGGEVSLAPSCFNCSWRVRYLRIESSQVVETPHCNEDECHSLCLCIAPKNDRRLTPLPRFTGEKLCKYSTSKMKEMIP